MRSLEERFVETIEDLEFPEVDLVEGVMARIAIPEPRASGSRRLAAAAVIAILVSVVATLVIEPARSAVADWFGIGATQIEFDPGGQATPGLPSNAALDGGEPAETELDPIAALGPPDSAIDLATARARRFSWRADANLPALGDTEVGVVLTVRAVEGPPDTKRLIGDASVEQVVIGVGGTVTAALWIGSPHEYVAADAVGPALAQQVLIWVSDGVQYRLEAELPFRDVVALAEAVAGGTDLLQPG